MKPRCVTLLLAGLAGLVVAAVAQAQTSAAPSASAASAVPWVERTTTIAPTPSTDKPSAHITVTPDCSPEYPHAALHTMSVGSTRLRFALDPNGRVLGVEIVESAGKTREHRLLDAAARAALARCSFTPALDANGTPIASTTDVTWRWKLR